MHKHRAKKLRKGILTRTGDTVGGQDIRIAPTSYNSAALTQYRHYKDQEGGGERETETENKPWQRAVDLARLSTFCPVENNSAYVGNNNLRL